VPIEDAAKRSAFPIYWLGESFDGKALKMVRVSPDASSVTVYYASDSQSGSGQTPGLMRIYQFSSPRLYQDLVSGLEEAGASPGAVTAGADEGTLWTGGSSGSTIVITRGITTVVVSGTPGQQESDKVQEAVERLSEVPR
jgi:hypothetical protein